IAHAQRLLEMLELVDDLGADGYVERGDRLPQDDQAGGGGPRRGGVSWAGAGAMGMRWRWPPLNSWGNSGATSGERPTRSSTAATRSAMAAPERSVWISSGSPMMSPTR